jgi:hypothetical protein
MNKKICSCGLVWQQTACKSRRAKAALYSGCSPTWPLLQPIETGVALEVPLLASSKKTWLQKIFADQQLKR